MSARVDIADDTLNYSFISSAKYSKTCLKCLIENNRKYLKCFVDTPPVCIQFFTGCRTYLRLTHSKSEISYLNSVMPTAYKLFFSLNNLV